MARALVCLAALSLGCGLVSKDFEISEPFQAGGGPPSFTRSFDSAKLTGPLTGDVSRISTLTLKAARIESTDGQDVSFVSDATISVSDPQHILADAKIATLSAPAAAGATSVDLAVTGKELKPYIQANGSITAAINYSSTPVTARAMQLVLTIHGAL